METDKCFTGIEAEGPDKGVRTLFVPGNISPEKFRDAWERLGDSPDIKNIYYGAGDDRELRIDTLRYIQQTTSKKLWCEFEDRTGDIFVIHHQTGALFRKIVSSVYIIWVPLVSKYVIPSEDSPVITMMDDTHFNTDEEV